MSETQSFKIPPITETDLDTVIVNAGGSRLHPDHDRRDKVGADYRLGEALIELKFLDQEGLDKVGRQKKIHKLFEEINPDQLAITLDRDNLQARNQRQFDSIMRGPIQTAVKKANDQLKQSRSEFSDTKCSVLLIINNNYSSLDHEYLCNLVLNRVRQDTSHIDTVVVGGVYFYLDGEDGTIFSPMQPFKVRTIFNEFNRLKASWEAFTDSFVEKLTQPASKADRTKGPLAEKQFKVGNVSYNRPVPGGQFLEKLLSQSVVSKSYADKETSVYVAKTLPQISRHEWFLFRNHHALSIELLDSFEMWMIRENKARKAAIPTCPLVMMPITSSGWVAWCNELGKKESISQYVNDLFKSRLDLLKSCAKDMRRCIILPARYTLAVTNVFGTDEAAALSSIFIVVERADGSTDRRCVVDMAGLSSEHAIALAAAYAIQERIESVMWEKNYAS
ncbi:hypothetical protein [Komagataeibacter oboediens]|uniref:Uncharacterized protein n=1 Tax=Komagataeibacter oboediens TaxID=65958 RepID=A0ABS5SRH3_9PROT|nr:hypothetical protein [Komagataeibacter oboediens]MBL7234178.1 hypothetical protein [Komagataeibacter oboediens]MBT0676838.1 hypothetical protein [Komagataeibacter oboediens]MBT0680134.1 hypothetical protein [Komagataeibacter oboediens]